MKLLQRLVLVALIASLSISVIRALDEEIKDEPQGEFSPEEKEHYDYEVFEELEGEEGFPSKQEYGGLPPNSIYQPPFEQPNFPYFDEPQYNETGPGAYPFRSQYPFPPYPPFPQPRGSIYQGSVFEYPSIKQQTYQPIYQQPQPQPLPLPQPQPLPLPQPQPQPLIQPQPIYSTTKYVTPIITQKITTYSAPIAYSIPIKLAQQYLNYSAPVIQTQRPYTLQPHLNYSGQVQGESSSFRYSPLDVASIVPISNYRANHPTLFYYQNARLRICPRGYAFLPTYKDIEAAFQYAIKQLAAAKDSSLSYIDSSQPSAIAKQQVLGFLSQQNARSDEEALLVEFVSLYLAERGCMSKWDRQRYLPQLSKFISVSNFPGTHSCSNVYSQSALQVNSNYPSCIKNRYRTFDGFCNNPYHLYWGKANICHARLLSPDYADGISYPRNSYNPQYPLPNPRFAANHIHFDIPQEGPYNLLKMSFGQFINHDITNTALSSYDGLVDCCKNPNIRGCWPIYVQGDPFYRTFNVSCLSFIRSGACPLCQLGPRQQINKNSAFLDLSQVYGSSLEQAIQLREFKNGLLKYTLDKNGEIMLPVTDKAQDPQCQMGLCFRAGDPRVNQYPPLTALHVMMLRSHNIIAKQLAQRHTNWNDEYIFQEARRISIAEYQMIIFNEYLPIIFGPILTSFYKLKPINNGYTYYDPKVDPSTWNEYVTAACRFGHSQIQSVFGLYSKVYPHGQINPNEPTFRLRDWFNRPTQLSDGLYTPIMNGLLSRLSYAVDPYIATDVREYLFKTRKEPTGGDLAATNIWRGRDHGIPGYIHYVEYCFNIKIYNWKNLALFIPPTALNQLRKVYKVVENIDLFSGGLAERHFPGADIGPTFACINGIQYYHLKFGDRFYFEHGNQAGSFNPYQLAEIKKATLARLICRSSYIQAVPQYAFLTASIYNPLVNCSQIPDLDYSKF